MVDTFPRRMERCVVASVGAADTQVDTESDQAKDDVLARNLWDLSVRTLKEKASYEVTM